MKTVGISVSDLVKMAKVVVGLSDAYDNEETVKGCYELNDIFKAQVRDLYIKSRMGADEKNIMCQISRDLRDARITELMDMRNEDDDDEED